MEKGVKKRKNYAIPLVFLVILIGLIISNVLVWMSFNDLVDSFNSLNEAFNKEKNKEKRVYFIETQSTVVEESVDDFCVDLCEEKRYDGHSGGELAYNGTFFVYDCSCFMVVR